MKTPYLVLAIALAACSKNQADISPITSTTESEKESISTLVDTQVNIIAAQESKVAKNPLKNAYFGETHIHTMYSLDAYIGGNRMNPRDSLQFAQGQAKIINGKLHKLQRPLDFAAVTDHAESIGEMYTAIDKSALGHNNPLLKELRSLTTNDEIIQWFVKYVVKNNRGTTPKHPPFYTGIESTKSAWQVILSATENEYKPGIFTTLAAFEWSSAPQGANLPVSYTHLPSPRD